MSFVSLESAVTASRRYCQLTTDETHNSRLGAVLNALVAVIFLYDAYGPV